MKPKNFPERKRQRQLRALSALSEPQRGVNESHDHFAARTDVILWRGLTDATAFPLRHKRTKKDRTARGRFVRAA